MKYYDWDTEKNSLLKALREICFKDVLVAIEAGYMLDICNHPNQKKYTGQRIFTVAIHGYAYSFPFVEDGEKIFFKTIFLNLKTTRDYIINP